MSRKKRKRIRRSHTKLPVVSTYISEWLNMTIAEVFSRFAGLDKAQHIGSGQRQFAYIPGSRKDKVLLVAHADTVFADKRRTNLMYRNGVYSSSNKQSGIGADDRAGCAILWKLKDSGHSLLILDGEESGCVGSNYLMSQPGWEDIINEHQFAIEFDRRGDNDLVTYTVGSLEFMKWLEANFTGYKKAIGSFTDICVLCDTICGVNISVGYYSQHTASEILIEKEWQRTLDATIKVLAMTDIPKFEHEPYVYSHYGYYDRLYDDDYDSPPAQTQTINENNRTNSIIVCPHCRGVMDVSELYAENPTCVHCKKGLEQ